jgi:hypothetical protein
MRWFTCAASAALVAAVLACAVWALPTETLPTYHWAYDVLEELQLQGAVSSLNLSERPVTRGQIAGAVIAEGDTEHSERVEWLLDLLRDEFASEITLLERRAEDVISETVGKVVSSVGLESSQPFRGDAGVRLQGDWAARQGDESVTDGIALAQVGVGFQHNMAAHARLRLDSHLPDDTTYDGKVWKDLAGYAEAGYFRVDGRIFDVQFGRDRFAIGSGKGTHLLLSDWSLPLDGLWVSASLKGFRYSFLTAELDTMILDRFPGEVVRRYLAMHRLWIHPHPRLSVGLTESVLYGGPNRTFEPWFLNPFLYWHGEVLNHKGEGNVIVMLDVDWFPKTGWELYGEFIIDDMQIEKDTPKDLEPDEIGWLVGTRYAGLPVLPHVVMGLEYLGVTNRTYNSMTPHEKYLHQGRLLGCELGNDVDRWTVSLSQWVRRDLQCELAASYLRKGEGSVTAPFDTTYLRYTVEEGYGEPFPTGLVQKETTVSLGVFFIPVYWGWVKFQSGMTWSSNVNHIEGEDRDEGWVTVSAVIELDDMFDRRH